MADHVLMVDDQDNVIGIGDKEECHDGDGILHRAVTVFIHDDRRRLLITRRSKEKRLWPETWESSCSTHVYERETYEASGERRLMEELGFTCPLRFLFKFQYQVKYGEIGAENEICALLLGRYAGKVAPNAREVAEHRWVEASWLQTDVAGRPRRYAPWFQIALSTYLDGGWT